MGVEDIVKYVKSTPHNTNPNVVRQMVLSEEEALLLKYTPTSDLILECLIETGVVAPFTSEGKILTDPHGRILI